MIRRPPRSTLFPTRRSSSCPRRSGTSTWWTGSRTERRRLGDLMRRGLTLAWVLALVAAFHWWDVTLRFPRLLVWTWAFLGLFLGTAAVLFGRGMRVRRREVWLPAAVWVALALGADLATVLFPAVSVEGRRVAAAVWLPIVDLVLPIWMTARALALVWTGASLWSFAAVAVPALAVWAWSVMIRMPGRSHAGPLQPLTAEEAAIRRDLEAHVRALAGTIGERHYARPQALARAVAYLQDALARLGYEVSVQPFAAGGQTFHNLEVVIPGGNRADEIVVVGGHYDTAEGSPGADDNGSGSAAVVVLAGVPRERPPAPTRGGRPLPHAGASLCGGGRGWRGGGRAPP